MTPPAPGDSEQDIEVCPYSDPPSREFTDDHIFPEFLGGRRSVRVCRDCNNRFGHSFEAEAAKQLKRLQVFVSHCGLDLSRTPASWPSALEIDGMVYNLNSGPQGTRYELARPVILRDETGKIVGGRARSRAEAEKAAASLLRKGKAKEVTVEVASTETLSDIKLNLDLSYNPDLYRCAAKIAANAAIFMGRVTLVKESGIPSYLGGSIDYGAKIAFCDTSPIRDLRPGLSHTVYLEFGPRSHAVVILFGAMQVYVPLPSSPEGAILGFLDPITGEESFREVTPLKLAPPPKFVTEGQARAFLSGVLRILAREANARGAKHPPSLSLGACDLGLPTTTFVFEPVWKSEGTWITLKF